MLSYVINKIMFILEATPVISVSHSSFYSKYFKYLSLAGRHQLKHFSENANEASLQSITQEIPRNHSPMTEGKTFDFSCEILNLNYGSIGRQTNSLSNMRECHSKYFVLTN